jgi:hypothetical protein
VNLAQRDGVGDGVRVDGARELLGHFAVRPFGASPQAGRSAIRPRADVVRIEAVVTVHTVRVLNTG